MKIVTEEEFSGHQPYPKCPQCVSRMHVNLPVTQTIEKTPLIKMIKPLYDYALQLQKCMSDLLGFPINLNPLPMDALVHLLFPAIEHAVLQQSILKCQKCNCYIRHHTISQSINQNP